MAKTYAEKLEHFREMFEKHHNERLARLYPDLEPEKVEVEQGYKFDKVYLVANNGQRLGRFMVESRSMEIYGIKSWTQVNKRRMWGTLDTVDQYDWSDPSPRPLPGTEAEKALIERETEIVSAHKKRGRKPKIEKLQDI